jgi:hypothetical protein
MQSFSMLKQVVHIVKLRYIFKWVVLSQFCHHKTKTQNFKPEFGAGQSRVPNLQYRIYVRKCCDVNFKQQNDHHVGYAQKCHLTEKMIHVCYNVTWRYYGLLYLGYHFLRVGMKIRTLVNVHERPIKLTIICVVGWDGTQSLLAAATKCLLYQPLMKAIMERTSNDNW